MTEQLPLMRVLITGASGTGTTTLGRALADALALPHAEVDDYYWLPTTPPYLETRPPEERLSLMNEVFVPRPRWILSGSMIGWGDALLPDLTAVVFLTLEGATRLSRLRRREHVRYGDSITPGGERHPAHHAFMEWAGGYDAAGFGGRSRIRHEAWLETVPCQVIRLDGAGPVADLLAAVLESIDVPLHP